MQVLNNSNSLSNFLLQLSLNQVDEDHDSGTESDEEIDGTDLPSGMYNYNIFVY